MPDLYFHDSYKCLPYISMIQINAWAFLVITVFSWVKGFCQFLMLLWYPILCTVLQYGICVACQIAERHKVQERALCYVLGDFNDTIICCKEH